MTDVVVFDVQSPADWSARICASWRGSVQAIIDTGRLIAGAKLALEHGLFEAMIESDLPFGARTAQMLMAISSDPRLTNPKHVSLLPPSWGTLYELHKLPDDAFTERIGDGTIRPDIERAEVSSIRKAVRHAPAQAAYQARVDAGCTLADLHALADSGAQFSQIGADPNWHYETYSEKGQDRSPGQHYKTDPLEPIKALPVNRLAAKNSILHLWCMDWLLPGAIEVIDAWGFRLINVGFVWKKLNPSGDGDFMGLGHWTRNGAELCLLATKGHPVRRSAAVRQVIEAPVGKHSEKPEEFYSRVEALSGGPFLDLYARKLRDNWTCWGDEIPRASFTIPTIITTPVAEEPPAKAPAESGFLPLPKTESPPIPTLNGGGMPEDPNDPDDTGIPIFLRKRESESVASPPRTQLVSGEGSG